MLNFWERLHNYFQRYCLRNSAFRIGYIFGEDCRHAKIPLYMINWAYNWLLATVCFGLITDPLSFAFFRRIFVMLTVLKNYFASVMLNFWRSFHPVFWKKLKESQIWLLASVSVQFDSESSRPSKYPLSVACNHLQVFKIPTVSGLITSISCAEDR